MKRSKKIIIYFSLALLVIIMTSLFYYSMRATLMDYFFENDQEKLEKITPASADQAQIMVDLANKQLAQQKMDTEVREDEESHKSLFNELSANEARVKTPAETASESSSTELDKSSDIDTAIIQQQPSDVSKSSNHVKNGFVVVDCEKGGVIACPHGDVQSGTSPLYYRNDNSAFLIGRCLDVSIDVKTFCP
jgi:hypothetical protein